MMLWVRVTLAAAAATIVCPQAPADRLAFEAASLRLSGPAPRGLWIPGALQGGSGTADPERVTASQATLQDLLRQAYGVQHDQIQGPGWIAEQKYDLIAKVPRGATKDDLKFMLQDLLVDRFKLSLHRATKNFPVYELTIAKRYTDEPGRIGSALSLPTSRDGAEPSGDLPFIEAIEKQLGLKLTKTTAPYEVLVIDRAERIPTEN